MIIKSRKTYLLRKKKEALENHAGVKNSISERLKLARVVAANQSLAKSNPKFYKEGCLWIKNILKFKKENNLLYFVGKQAETIFIKYPKIDSPEAIKSILIASVNPNLTTKKIDSIISNLYSKNISKKARKEVIITIIRSISLENYKYLL